MNIHKDPRPGNDVADGDYDRPNANRERWDRHHHRKLAEDDLRHQQQVRDHLRSSRSKHDGQESSFYGGVGDQQGREYERQSGYRESYRKIGEGHLHGNENQSFPNYHGKRKGAGPHAGKGPQSYQRTETRILEDVNECLLENPELDATDISVTIEDGEIVLSGTVADRRSKRLAASLCEAILGVRNVQNRLRVMPSIGNGMSIGS